MNFEAYKKLDQNEKITLEHLYRYEPNTRLHERAHMILLSKLHFEIRLIAKITFHDRDTVSRYINGWDTNGLGALYDAPKSGRNKILTPDEETNVIEEINKAPRQLNKTLSIIPGMFKKSISKRTLKCILKCARFRWQRARRVTHKKPSEAELIACKERLTKLNTQEMNGEIDL